MIDRQQKAFFRVDDDVFVGNDAARGPWAADACHAGPVTAVIARALERQLPDKQLARITVNFRRPIPMSGFRVTAELERDGRATATATANLSGDDERVCAVAYGLYIRGNSFPDLPSASVPSPVFSEATPGEFPVEDAAHGLPFFSSGIEVAYPPGESADAGPTTMWMRTLPIVEGESPSPFESLCPLADCGNGISRNASVADATFVNPDITIAVFRLPVSDWLASRAISFWEPTGIGLSQAQLFDTQGALGFAMQTLVITPLEK